MSIHLLWPMAAVASFILTWLAIRFAEARGLLDVPNERSSHERPVPRGGGIAIVLTFIAGTLLAAASAIAGYPLQVAIALGGGGVAAIGLLDDWRGSSPVGRLALHAIAAIWVVYSAGGLPGDLLPGLPVMLVNVIGVVCTVWLINLFNFMDGIDGIASIEAMTVCLGAIVVYAFSDGIGTAWLQPAILLASVAGFLVWNYPPARVFLGDTGSGFLGFLMAAFCVHAAQKLGRHAPVSLAVGAINLGWLLPLALLVATDRLHLIAGLLLAYLPLIWLAIRFRSGAPTERARSG